MDHAIGARLYAIMTPEVLPLADFPAVARVLAELGVPVVQVRVKGNVDDRARLELVRAVLAALPRTWLGILVVNDRADLARILAFENPERRVGLHLGQTDLPPKVARAIVGPDVFIGLSTHTAEQVDAALTEPVDYIAFGPIFPTHTKDNPDPVVGLDGLARAREAAGTRRLVAIGGIDSATVRDVYAAGADLVAVASALLSGPLDDLAARVAAFAEAAGPGARA